MLKKTIFFAMLASLTISSGLQAQYRWHIVQPAAEDTIYYAFGAVASYGHSCVALGSSWSQNLVIDTGFSLTSTDDGMTWAKHYFPKKFDTLQPDESIEVLQMIDSLNVYGISFSWFWRSTDGGASWIPQHLVGNADGFPTDNLTMDFFNSKEGIVCTNTQTYYTTSNGGNSWDSGTVSYARPSACKAYGNGKFRILSTLLYTTMNYGKSTSSSFLYPIPGSAGDTGFHTSFIELGGGDTIMAFCVHANPPASGYHTFVYVSTDSGADWTEQSMLDTNYSIIPYVATSVDSSTVFVGNYPPEIVTYSTDHGTTWQTDSTIGGDSLPNGDVASAALAGTQNMIATIQANNIDTLIVNGQPIPVNGSALARLEPIPSSVTPTIATQQNLTLYPNPATNTLNLVSPTGTISISDPLGRSYAVPRNGNEMDISTLPPGVYFVSDGVNRAKFVKE